MTAQPTLNAAVREGSGKGIARKLRAEGLVPGICYGRGMDNIRLAIDPDEFDKIKERPQEVNTVFQLSLDNGDVVENVMLRDYQFHPVRRVLTHVDLIAVSMEEPLVVSVPVTTRGKAKGVAMGGRLRFIQPVVPVSCTPDNIPEVISVDVTELTPDGAIMASELDYPENVEPSFKMDFAIIRIQMPRKKKLPGAAAEAVEEPEEGAAEETEGEESPE